MGDGLHSSCESVTSVEAVSRWLTYPGLRIPSLKQKAIHRRSAATIFSNSRCWSSILLAMTSLWYIWYRATRTRFFYPIGGQGENGWRGEMNWVNANESRSRIMQFETLKCRTTSRDLEHASTHTSHTSHTTTHASTRRCWAFLFRRLHNGNLCCAEK